MRIQLLAAGTRMPDWVDTGVAEYSKRFSGQIKFAVKEIPLGVRNSSADAPRAMAEEGRRMLAALKPGTFVTTLEVKGKPLTTEQLAAWLKQRLQSGQDLALLRLLLGRVRKNDAAGRLLVRLQPFDHDLVIQRNNLHRATPGNEIHHGPAGGSPAGGSP